MFSIRRSADPIHVLEIDDGKVNVIGPDFVEAFPKAWATATSGARGIVLAGNARAFCAGLDLKRIPQLEESELLAFAQRFNALFLQILSEERPVVAAVDGPAIAGGAILALCADIVVASPRARMGVTEVSVGVPFPPSILALLERKLAPPELFRATLSSALREGEDCVRFGWAHTFVRDGPLLDAAVQEARNLANGSPVAYRMAKVSLLQSTRAALAQQGVDGARAWLEAVSDPENLEALVRTAERLAKPKGP
ncbi:MAG: enoyl-CoA hydratase/isomerase family protein [Thermoplasmatota archaeon]